MIVLSLLEFKITCINKNLIQKIEFNFTFYARQLLLAIGGLRAGVRI